MYDPFGEVAAVTGVSQITVGFQGDYTDPTTSEVWMGARWYDPTGAQFRSRDTVFGELSTPVSLNRYTYGFANPLLFWDPDGKFAQLGPLIEGAFRSADAFRAQVKADQKIKTPAQRKALVRRRRRISGEGFDAPTPRRAVQFVVFDINAIYLPTTSSEQARKAEQVWLNRNNFVAPILGLPQDQNLAGGGACEAAPATIYHTRDDQPQAQPELILFGVSLRCSVRTNVVIPTEAGLLVGPFALIEMLGDGSGGTGSGNSRKSLLKKIDEGITEWLARRSITNNAEVADGYVNLASPERTRHILEGEVLPDGSLSGGHRAGTGFRGKSEFPAEWSDAEIMHNVSDVATDPLSVTRAGRGGDVFITGTRGGIEIEVLVRNGEIWTSYPTNVPRNRLP